ncbi:uncharacterized protein LOC128894297 [Hylaeus anthracinus]|uniref:uncharacterized protein LOC128894297 n=1 Tax=Hylaeus anthracinus TaxID=313031 RepID=UPI0023B88E12|nr:uncharacterized protein LOC128894297 [Hylaeus anthracinus]
MFDSLVLGVMLYGAEVFGWRERSELEGVQTKYIRWCLSLDFCIPKYMILEGTKREKIRIRTGIKALRFEEKIRNGVGRELLKECLKEKETAAESRGVKRRRERCSERGLRPEYLNKTGKGDNQKLIARIRYGNLEEGNRYWLKEEERKCGLCKLKKGRLIEDCQELERGELKEETLVEGRVDERVAE